ncbi:MAG: two-component system sensor histidine kinase CreC [Burkholderiaceae bacterium]
MLVYVIGIAFLLYDIVRDLDPRYREATEEALVETAQVLAAGVERDVHDGVIDTAALATTMKAAYARQFDAQVFGFAKNHVDLRVYVVDRAGRVIYDSTGRAVGADYSGWRDVALTLAGFYGARTTPDVAGDQRTAVMYVAAPIYAGDAIVGALAAGKPTQSFGQFVEAARNKIILVGIGSALAVLMFAFIVSIWLVRPFGLVGDAARAMTRDRRAGSFERFVRQVRRTPRALREAYRDMRDAVSGRSYVEDYVQTLTHELKSPLSAIQGAAELLEEPMPEAERRRFLANIARETDRIRELADRMLELAVLEQRHRLDAIDAVDAVVLGEDVVSTAAGRGRGIRVRFVNETIGRRPEIEGDAFLLRRALANLIDNAIDFSPDDGTVDVTLDGNGSRIVYRVRDHGPGIPDYAGNKVFEKFFSLQRPRTQKKSTGLGLAFVREIAGLHRGSIALANHPDGGAVATLTLTRY